MGDERPAEEAASEAATTTTNDRPSAPVLGVAAGLALLLLLVVALLGIPVLSLLAKASIGLALVVAATWLTVRLLRRLLWRVSHRLAFSYFLIGVLPIPMVAALLLVGSYLVAGFVLAQQNRAALRSLSEEVRAVATLAVDAYSFEDVLPASPFAEISIAYYENGVRTRGTLTSPERWPEWLESESQARPDQIAPAPPSIATFPDGALTVAAAQRVGDRAVLAYFDGDLAHTLARRAVAWVELTRKGDPGNEPGTTLQIGDNEWQFRPLRRAEARGSMSEFFAERGLPTEPLVIGLDSLGPAFDLADGEISAENVSATVFAPPRAIAAKLFSDSRDVDTLGWLAFIVPAFLLFDLYVVAAVMAIFLIAGLSRAVDQLSGATSRIEHGNFGARIEVRRRDQLGALHRTFNQMASNLERAVEEATQKEIIDKELEIARDLQRSLLPVQLQFGDRIEVASYFEPSAAIGGDYYDIVPLDEERSRLAIAIADVSGHGLPAGLRTAMLKAALDILVRERKAADDIFHTLDGIVRSGTERTFVTATLTVLELDEGIATITNAGHCPTYHVPASGASVEEIVLPGTPLGALRQSYGHRRVELAVGDCLVWLSDGLIEAENHDGEVFGYERIVATLESAREELGDTTTSEGLRDALVRAVRDFSDGLPAQDDRTLVVLRCLEASDPASEP